MTESHLEHSKVLDSGLGAVSCPFVSCLTSDHSTLGKPVYDSIYVPAAWLLETSYQNHNEDNVLPTPVTLLLQERLVSYPGYIDRPYGWSVMPDKLHEYLICVSLWQNLPDTFFPTALELFFNDIF
jgi:hypothetical protein